jgi:Sulfotransferase family
VTEPIFVLGIAQRSGTHYLYDALLQHADCAPALEPSEAWRSSWEDELLAHSELLFEYERRLAARWGTWVPTDVGARLLRSLGDGISEFLNELAARGGAESYQRPVVKSPTVEQLERFDQLFPSAALVVIVRHPAAVVASSLATWGGLAERWIRVWRTGARSILDFDAANPGRAVVVRYEDLCADPVRETRRVVAAIGLSVDGLDEERVATLPVRGSSQLRPDGEVGWTPTAPTPTFDPLRRGESLSADVEGRLAWLAGSELRALGYPCPDPPAHRVLQRALDWRWDAGRVAYRAGRTIARASTRA